jgi:hypothetical protein
VVLPFVALLIVGLLLIIFVPRLSSFTVEAEVAELRAKAEEAKRAPTEAWALECIQEDRNNLRPCSPADIEKYGADGRKLLDMADADDDDDDGDEDLDALMGDDDDEDADMDALMGDDDDSDAGADDEEAPDDEDAADDSDEDDEPEKGKDSKGDANKEDEEDLEGAFD